MARLSGNARFLVFFVNSIVEGRSITVTAPNQYASIMDVSDAVAGIISVVNLPIIERSIVYNLGPGVQHSILDYAKTANEMGKSFGYESVSIEVEDGGKDFAICMDCKKLMSQTGWRPIITKTEMLNKLYNSIK